MQYQVNRDTDEGSDRFGSEADNLENESDAEVSDIESTISDSYSLEDDLLHSERAAEIIDNENELDSDSSEDDTGCSGLAPPDESKLYF
jgi:hypothetical protein